MSNLYDEEAIMRSAFISDAIANEEAKQIGRCLKLHVPNSPFHTKMLAKSQNALDLFIKLPFNYFQSLTPQDQ